METINSYCHGKKLSLYPFPEHSFNLDLPKGKISILIGKNGSGKTTLLKGILGIPETVIGNIFILDIAQPTQQLKPREIANVVSYVGQESVFPQDLLVEDYLRLAFLPKVGLFFQSLPKTTYEMEDLALKIGVDRHFKKTMRKISTGERQRVFLTRALLQNPRLLLLDEPTNHLDPGAKKNFWNLLIQLKKEKDFEILISTHDLEFVKSFGEWVVGLRDGNLQFSFDKNQLTDKDLEELYFEDPDAE